VKSGIFSACGLASVFVRGQKKKRMLSRKRNGKNRFFTFDFCGSTFDILRFAVSDPQKMNSP